MVCRRFEMEFCQQLLNTYILDIYYDNLPIKFQKINEYDSISVLLSNNSILRVQCTLRILYNNQLFFLSNDRFIDNDVKVSSKTISLFEYQLQKLSFLTMNAKINDIKFTQLGDIKLLTSNGYEFQILIDTRRTQCISYENINFDTKMCLCVLCENGEIIGINKRWN